LILGLSSLRVEAEILASNPSMHVTFMDISPGSLARRAEMLGARFPGRVATVCADLNFAELERNAYDCIASSSSLHHVTNLEHLAWQIDGSLTTGGWFFLNDYVGEPRFQFAPAKRQVFTLLHDREAMRTPGRQLGCCWMDASDLSPFCGVRSDELLPVFRTHLQEVEVRTASTLTAALLRARPADGATLPPRTGLRRLWDVAVRAAYGAVGKKPPVRVPVPTRFLQELMLVGDVAADSGLLLPGTAYATYRKRG
jgi:SAM-dependent methyltransferase